MDQSSVQTAPSIEDDEWDTEGYVIPSLELEDSGQNNSNLVEVEESKTVAAESKKEENIYLGPHGAPPSQSKQQELGSANNRKQKFRQKLKEADKKYSGSGRENKVEHLRELVGGKWLQDQRIPPRIGLTLIVMKICSKETNVSVILVSWNAMIHGLAMHGRGKKALELFIRMKQEGFVPDKVTLVGILCACNHTGLVDEGILFFYSMEKDYGVKPEVEHYGCLIDLLGRGGYVREAFELARKMPLEPNIKIWGSLLGACRMHKDVELADDVRSLLVKLEPKNAGKLSALSNIYASAGDWDNVANIRLMMKNIGRPNQSGGSLLLLNDEYREFTVMDKSHVKSDKIYQMIDRLGQHLKLLSPVPAGLCDE